MPNGLYMFKSPVPEKWSNYWKSIAQIWKIWKAVIIFEAAPANPNAAHKIETLLRIACASWGPKARKINYRVPNKLVDILTQFWLKLKFDFFQFLKSISQNNFDFRRNVFQNLDFKNIWKRSHRYCKQRPNFCQPSNRNPLELNIALRWLIFHVDHQNQLNPQRIELHAVVNSSSVFAQIDPTAVINSDWRFLTWTHKISFFSWCLFKTAFNRSLMDFYDIEYFMMISGLGNFFQNPEPST